VILGYFSENITRNISQERGFQTNQILQLKPRFLLQGNELRLVPLPNLTEAEYRSLRSRARELLPHDYFAPGGPSGIRSLEFPYLLSVAGAFQHYRLQARLRGRPSYAQFYDPEHPSGALPLTEAIIKTFVDTARSRGQKPMVLLIPDEKDLRWLRGRGVLPFAELAERLRSAGVIAPRVAEVLERKLGSRDPCEIYNRCASGHFTPEGYRWLAETAYAGLTEAGWLR
jgi:hypothetical protein